MAPKKRDLTGQQFGGWIAVEARTKRYFKDDKPGYATEWKVRCTLCGFERWDTYTHIVNRPPKCECVKRAKRAADERRRQESKEAWLAQLETTKIHIGDKYGKWTVIGEPGPTLPGRHPKYLCRCQCGEETYVAKNTLRSGESTQCRLCASVGISSTGEGTNWRKAGRGLLLTANLNNADLFKIIPKKQWTSICKGAIDRNIEFDLEIEFLEKLFFDQGERCALSGLPLRMHPKSGLCTASLDRRDSQKGYVPGNVQWVHKHINIIKLDFDENYFIGLCEEIVRHQYAKIGITPDFGNPKSPRLGALRHGYLAG